MTGAAAKGGNNTQLHAALCICMHCKPHVFLHGYSCYCFFGVWSKYHTFTANLQSDTTGTEISMPTGPQIWRKHHDKKYDHRMCFLDVHLFVFTCKRRNTAKLRLFPSWLNRSCQGFVPPHNN